MEFLALAILVATLVAAFVYSRKNPNPRKVFASATAHGMTERDSGEIIQMSISLFEDETDDQHYEKIKRICDLRERRLQDQNMAMMKHHADLKERHAELEAQVKASGGKVKTLQK